MQVPYYLTFENFSVAAASGDHDLCEITPADEGPVEIIGVELVGFDTDADEYLRVQWFSDNATTGNGTATTPRPQDPFVVHTQVPTCETGASTPASTGTAIGLNIVSTNAKGGTNGPIWYPANTGPRISQSDTMLCLRLLAAVADDVTFSGTIYLLVG
jgi:hypothetical protein